jgi:endonuclease/exonuclease/phosphatase family metal-dependent hydrolase
MHAIRHLPSSSRMQTLWILLSMLFPATAGFAQTGTFVDRVSPTDLRVASYNIYYGTNLANVGQELRTKFIRVIQAVDADVWNLQEIDDGVHTLQQLFNTQVPLEGGASWHVHQGGDNAIVSKYPLSMQRVNTNPTKDGTGIALVDLPDDQFSGDLYVMNNHFTCCNVSEPPGPLDGREVARQREADALANWMRDARTPGEFVDLPPGTAMMVVGDLNIINEPNVLDPLGTIITGDVYDETRFGLDSLPDWDGTFLADAHPFHNSTGVEDYTWRDDRQPYDPGRLDYILYTDSVLEATHQFALNTVAMTAEERAATGLQEFDITLDSDGLTYDHLPLVVDFKAVPFELLPGDFNDDGQVNLADYTVWRDHLGEPAGTLPNDIVGTTIGAGQYALWKHHFGTSDVELPGPLSERVPEPATVVFAAMMLTLAGWRSRGTTGAVV